MNYYTLSMLNISTEQRDGYFVAWIESHGVIHSGRTEAEAVGVLILELAKAQKELNKPLSYN